MSTHPKVDITTNHTSKPAARTTLTGESPRPLGCGASEASEAGAGNEANEACENDENGESVGGSLDASAEDAADAADTAGMPKGTAEVVGELRVST